MNKVKQMKEVLSDFILVIEPSTVTQSASGMVIAVSTEATLKTTVIGVGPGDVDEKGKPLTVEVEPGDTVYIPKEVVKTAPKTKINGVSCMFIKQPQILVWEKPE